MKKSKNCFIKMSKVTVFLVIFFFLTFNNAYAVENIKNDLMNTLKNYYLNSIPENIKNSNSIDDIISGFNDPYLKCYDMNEYESYINYIENSFTSIGIYTDKLNKGLRILGFSEISTARDSGLRSNDVIASVNGISLADKIYKESITLLDGRNGSIVYMKVLRENKELSFIVKRNTSNNSTVSYKILENNIGYIKISNFGYKTIDDFDKCNSYLENNKVNSYIIDIRDNPGGYISSAIEIASRFVSNNVIAIAKDKNNNISYYNGNKQNKVINKPVVVLINKNTASSAEIFASALKYNNKALLVGENTFGKGTEQEFIKISDNMILKLTIKKLYTPSFQAIDKIGIAPDIKSDNYDSLKMAELLLAKAPAKQNKNGYILINMDNKEYAININNSVEDISMINSILTQVYSNNNVYSGTNRGWIRILYSYNERPWQYLFPNYTAMNLINSNNEKKIYKIYLNEELENNATIEMVALDTGNKIKSNSIITKGYLYLNIDEKIKRNGYYAIIVNCPNKGTEYDNQGIIYPLYIN